MNTKRFGISLGLLGGFLLWTLLVCFVDVHPIGPNGSSVGLATLNEMVHTLTGTNLILYTLTDWLGLIPLLICAGFGMQGLIQWIGRKRIACVDRRLIILGCFYLLVMFFFAFFECFPVNYRPVLIDGKLEASYPSSTTLLVLCVIPTAVIPLRKQHVRPWLAAAAAAFVVLMVVARVLSGVHWITDIIGGILLSCGLVALYSGFRP